MLLLWLICTYLTVNGGISQLFQYNICSMSLIHFMFLSVQFHLRSYFSVFYSVVLNSTYYSLKEK